MYVARRYTERPIGVSTEVPLVTLNPGNSVELSDDEWARLARYLAGEASSAERTAFEAWVGADPARRDLVDSVADAWRRTGALPKRPVDVDAAWATMSRRMAAADADRATPGRTVSARPAWSFSPALALAAGALLMVGGIALWPYLKGVDDSSDIAPSQTLVTGPGERRTIILADSTEVVLGVASRLEVATGYGGDSRALTLEGEALFRVRHDAARPFVVRVGGAITEDLGTVFSIRSYGAADTVRVVVTEGSVALRTSGAATGGAIVRAGERAVLAPGGTATVSPALNTESDLAWTRGEIVFEDASLSQVAEVLSRWYDVSVMLGDSELASRRLTTTFSGDSLSHVLRVIELTVGVRVERSGRIVTLRAARTAPR